MVFSAIDEERSEITRSEASSVIRYTDNGGES